MIRKHRKIILNISMIAVIFMWMPSRIDLAKQNYHLRYLERDLQVSDKNGETFLFL